MPTIKELKDMYNMHELYHKHDDRVEICQCGRVMWDVILRGEIFNTKGLFFKFLKNRFHNITSDAIEYFFSINTERENWIKTSTALGIFEYGDKDEREELIDVIERYKDILDRIYMKDLVDSGGSNVLLALLNRDFATKSSILETLTSAVLFLKENRTDVIYRINDIATYWPSPTISALIIDGLDLSKIKLNRNARYYVTLAEENPMVLEKKLKLVYKLIKENPNLNKDLLSIIIPFNFDVVVKNKMHYIGYKANKILYSKMISKKYLTPEARISGYSDIDMEYIKKGEAICQQ